MAGGKARIQVGRTLPKLPRAIPLERTLPLGGQLDGRYDYERVGQCLSPQQPRFAEALFLSRSTGKIETRRDRQQGVRCSKPRRPSRHGDLVFGVRKLRGRVLVGGNQRAGGGTEDQPPLDVLAAGVKRTRPDVFLIVQDVSRKSLPGGYRF